MVSSFLYGLISDPSTDQFTLFRLQSWVDLGTSSSKWSPWRHPFVTFLVVLCFWVYRWLSSRNWILGTWLVPVTESRDSWSYFRVDFDRIFQTHFWPIRTPRQASATLHPAAELDTVPCRCQLCTSFCYIASSSRAWHCPLQVGIYFFPPTALVNTTQPLRRREADLVLCTSDLNVLIRPWCPEPVYSYTWQPFVVCLNYFQRNCL